MQLSIAGRQIDTGEALRGHVEERLEAGVSKYFTRPVNAAVTFAREGSSYRAECHVHLDSGLRIQASASDPDIYSAFDATLVRIEKQLRRYKRRLKDHHSDKTEAMPAAEAASYVISGDAPEEESAAEGDAPAVIAEEVAHVRTLTVGQAVMHLDLAHAPALMFKNAAHGRLNVVYRRDDGNIGWIDPRADS